jgi:hypothetical protein
MRVVTVQRYLLVGYGALLLRFVADVETAG